MSSAFWNFFLIAQHKERPLYHVHLVTSRFNLFSARIAKSLCTKGWQVCNPRHSSYLKLLTWEDVSQLDGCYAYNAANTLNQCARYAKTMLVILKLNLSAIKFQSYEADILFVQTKMTLKGTFSSNINILMKQIISSQGVRFTQCLLYLHQVISSMPVADPGFSIGVVSTPLWGWGVWVGASVRCGTFWQKCMQERKNEVPFRRISGTPPGSTTACYKRYRQRVLLDKISSNPI